MLTTDHRRKKPTSVRHWDKMSDDEILLYGKKSGYEGWNPKRLKNKDQGYYTILNNRHLTYKLLRKLKRSWQNMTDDEILEYGKNHGYDKLNARELIKQDVGYSRALSERGLKWKLLKGVMYRIWKDKTDEELIDYGRKNNLDKLSRTELQEKNRWFYKLLSERGLLEYFIKSKLRLWTKLTDEEVLSFGLKKNYQNISITELEDLDGSYYLVLKRRGLLDKLLIKYVPKIKSPDEFKQFIENSDFAEQSKKIIETYGGNTADLADILSVVSPTRLTRDKAIEFLRDPSIRPWIGPIVKPDIPISELIQRTVEILPYDKEDIIWNIFLRRASEYRDHKLGPSPTKEQRELFLQELDEGLKRMYSVQ